jgi:hypothetical protein
MALIQLTVAIFQNAFSERLLPLGFNLFPIFVVDLMHDFELGVWRSLFIHLLRILDSAGKNLLAELDRRWVTPFMSGNRTHDDYYRYRNVPSFGTAIRKFSTNSSEMKKLAARDMENLLQVCIITKASGNLLICNCSVQFQSLTASYPKHITGRF